MGGSKDNGSLMLLGNTTAAPTNSQTTEGVCLVFPEELHIASQIFSFTIGILSLYCTMALTLHFAFSKRRLTRHERYSRKYSGPARDQGKQGRLYKQMMNMQMIMASLSITLRCILDFVLLRTGYLHNPIYTPLSMVEVLLNIAALSSMYLVLWIRQWSFYCHPALEDAKFGKIKILCILLLLIMVATGVWNAIAFLSDRDVTLDENDCIQTGSTTMYKFYVLGACTLFYQIFLLGLFAYPIALHTRKNIFSETNKRKSIMRVLKRVFVVAIICSGTDLITSILSAVLEPLYPESSFLLYNLNIASNFLALMYSFGDCRIRLCFPFLMCKKKVPQAWNGSMTVNSVASSQG